MKSFKLEQIKISNMKKTCKLFHFQLKTGFILTPENHRAEKLN